MSSKRVRVRVPEMNIGPPFARYKRSHEQLVDIGQAETMVAEVGAEILEDEPATEPKPKAGKGKAKSE